MRGARQVLQPWTQHSHHPAFPVQDRITETNATSSPFSLLLSWSPPSPSSFQPGSLLNQSTFYYLPAWFILIQSCLRPSSVESLSISRGGHQRSEIVLLPLSANSLPLPARLHHKSVACTTSQPGRRSLCLVCVCECACASKWTCIHMCIWWDKIMCALHISNMLHFSVLFFISQAQCAFIMSLGLCMCLYTVYICVCVHTANLYAYISVCTVSCKGICTTWPLHVLWGCENSLKCIYSLICNQTSTLFYQWKKKCWPVCIPGNWTTNEIKEMTGRIERKNGIEKAKKKDIKSTFKR